ncbi:MAG: stage III sporulation protein AG [Oscillospiraceae bacterium]|nr:stage III sporulation protein AG [Oscillospiraceae bacterium]
MADNVQWKWPAAWKGGAGKYKYLLLVVFAGILLLLPAGKSRPMQQETDTQPMQERFDLQDLEHRLEKTLSKIGGAGEVTVLLTLKDGGRQVYAQDVCIDSQEQTSTLVVIGRGSGVEQPVPVQRFSPTFQGALAICPGGGDSRVRLQLTQAICALTGLSTEKVTVCQSE